jgi:predicted negative regulator of RcsB-dependent stress response
LYEVSVDKLTRKELKTDKFAEEVQHSVEFVAHHRRQMIQWGVPAAAVVLIVLGVLVYRNYQHNARQEAFHAATLIQNSQVGPSQSEYVVSFPTAQARQTAVVKTWRDFVAKYSGTEEGAIAEFFLGTNAADTGDLDDAVKHFKAAIDSGSAPYASEAKLALAQVYGAQGKVNDGVQLIQSVIDHPTVMVSKDAATLALADLIKTSDPQRARKLVDPLRTSTRAAVSKAAITLDSSLSQQ